MTRLHDHPEHHSTERIGWLRAAVLGANDGIVSTASLIVGVAASDAGRAAVLVAGVASLFAGAMSMAAGEYVSVSSQSDTERAEVARERKELAMQPEVEREELIGIYQARGVDRETAERVADQLMAMDALGAHAREELGLSSISTARPFQAALTSALTFTAGAAAPLAVAAVAPESATISAVVVASLAGLATLGALGARVGGAPFLRSTLRVAAARAALMHARAQRCHRIGNCSFVRMHLLCRRRIRVEVTEGERPAPSPSLGRGAAARTARQSDTARNSCPASPPASGSCRRT